MAEYCPYCNEFMEISKNSPECTHLSIDPENEWCCPNCDVHFDLDLNEVPIDIGIARPNPTPPPSQNPSQESSTESKGDSKSDSTTPTTPAKPSHTPSPNFPPAQIALAEQVLLKLQEYQDFSKIKTSIIPIVQSLQSYPARDFAKVS